MASILTNASSMAALQTLRSIGNNMETTQGRISTGLKVGSASDNAAYWSIATTMRSDASALSTVSDALGIGAAKVDTAYSGMEATIKVVQEIKDKLILAQDPTADKKKIQKEIGQLQKQLTSIADSATFNGENWLKTKASNDGAAFAAGTDDAAIANLKKQVVASFTRDSAGAVKVQRVDLQLSGSNVLFDTGAVTDGKGTGILDKAAVADGVKQSVSNLDISDLSIYKGAGATMLGTAAATDNDILDKLITHVDKQLETLNSAAADLGAVSNRISMQGDFVSKLTATMEKGIGRLVDADMNEESTRLKALQTQQQLAIQALSIANSDSQNILSLFR
ncbi:MULTISPECIES: flagellin [Rhizobium/Agrobacterium group]|jgi:flagellin|uniref:Flagellin n=2 Tax=Rhizobium/Agrobacterium group TaxID=227290 RepID=A0AA86FTW0_AGRTU|nr:MULTISPECIES: flagellin [Rhizobium/Agrobacterium group]AHK00403.1 flagellin protein FlaA [Agrobacterium tumefaciens LBA4213 (Ach5)]AKC06250.1 flagellin [Agrobacterium tumefaciens]EHJ98333.1 putative flagellin B [Agrobacterium tumefaciens 5A]MDP9559718.1 flagellin [Rhizobium nepotum]QDG92230.1 flagellin [Rhizobium sp. NIBRBAC000502774]